MENDLEIIERDLITKFRKDIYRPFCKALDKYDILKDGDKIAICISRRKRLIFTCKMYARDSNTWE